MLKLDLGDSLVWMTTAEDLYVRSACAAQSGSGYPQSNELNVASVCAGYAFELLFKVLVRACGGKPAAQHPPRKAYEELKTLADKEVRSSVNEILLRHGWNDPDHLLTFLDDLCKIDRKYWGLPPSGEGPRSSTFHVGGRKAFDTLRRLHRDLTDLALSKIRANSDVQENWPGLQQRQIDKPRLAYPELQLDVKTMRENRGRKE